MDPTPSIQIKPGDYIVMDAPKELSAHQRYKIAEEMERIKLLWGGDFPSSTKPLGGPVHEVEIDVDGSSALKIVFDVSRDFMVIAIVVIRQDIGL
ncbi:MAG: hypothetical protein P4M05_32935 [Bradyrhizobium sp.]|nr:hypothetical protein [Bradyrhizobium sp.]